MMPTTKPGRPSRGQITCSSCKHQVSPKNGDWFVASSSHDQQFFLCQDCERKNVSQIKRATAAR